MFDNNGFSWDLALAAHNHANVVRRFHPGTPDKKMKPFNLELATNGQFVMSQPTTIQGTIWPTEALSGPLGLYLNVTNNGFI